MKRLMVFLGIASFLTYSAALAAETAKPATPAATTTGANTVVTATTTTTKAAETAKPVAAPEATAPATTATAEPTAITDPFSDPFANMMNNFFAPTPGMMVLNSDKRFLPIRMVGGYPKMDMYETHDNLMIQFEIPGIEKEKLNLEITDSYVSLKYQEAATAENKDKKYSINERSYGSFARVVSLPSYVDSKLASAEYKNGVLNITIPKSEAAKSQPKKLEIK